MGPRQIFWVSSDPPTMLCPGAGGWLAISWLKIEPQYDIVETAFIVGYVRDRDGDQAGQRTTFMHRARTVQMSHEASSMVDFIRAGDVVIVVKLDRLGRNTHDVLNLVHELAEKGASLRALEPSIDTSAPMARWSSLCWAWSPRWSLASSSIGSARASTPLKRKVPKRPSGYVDRVRSVPPRKEGMGRQ